MCVCVALSLNSVVILSRKSMEGLFCNALEALCLFFSLSVSVFVAVCVQEERSRVIRCLLANAKSQKYFDSVCCGQR